MMKQRRILLVLFGLIVSLSLVMANKLMANELIKGQYITVEISRDIPTVPLGGTVIPEKEVMLTAQLPGRINYIAGREGESFKANTLLISLDESELQAKNQAAYAQLANADYALRNSGVQFTREYYSPQSYSSMGGMGMPNLFDRVFTKPMEGFFGKRDRNAERYADLTASQIRIEQARMQILTAQAEIQALAAKIRDSKSVAPFDGVIISKFVENGDTVQPGQMLLKFANLDDLQIVIDVPSRLAAGLTAGDVLQAIMDGANEQAGERIAVKIAQVYPMADTEQHTVKVKFDLPKGASLPGMYAKVLIPDFNAASTRLPVIPSSAIHYKGSLPWVFIKGKTGQPELRLVRIGEQLGRGFVSILAGIKPGDQVLVKPQSGAGFLRHIN